MDSVVRRLMTALRVLTPPSAGATFRLGVGEITYGGDPPAYRSRRCTIHRKAGDVEWPVADVYGVEYTEILTREFESRNLLVRCLLSVLTVVSSIRLLASSRSRQPDRRGASAPPPPPPGSGGPTAAAPAKQPLTGRQKRQLLWAMVILLLLSLYTLVLIGTILDVVVQWVRPPVPKEVTVNTKGAEPVQTGREGVWVRVKGANVKEVNWPVAEHARNAVRSLVILLTALGVFSSVDWRRKLRVVATEYLSVYAYIRGGGVQTTLGGQVESLLDAVLAATPHYRRVHVVAFSFGSVLVLDRLFPRSSPNPQWGRVDTLVTIGCPFDLIRTPWPEYFRGRRALGGVGAAPRHWCNVYMLSDILGANFRNDESAGPAQEGVEVSLAGDGADPPGGGGGAAVVRKPDANVHYEVGFQNGQDTWLGTLQLVGFQAHGLYWGQGSGAETNCFPEVVKCLYRGSWVLPDAPEASFLPAGDRAGRAG